MRHKKQGHSKTVRRFRNIHEPIRSVIKNADLEKHRRTFLGKPGSKQWHEFYSDLIKTKRRLFKEESIQDRNEKKQHFVLDKKHKTLKLQKGGTEGEGDGDEDADNDEQGEIEYDDEDDDDDDVESDDEEPVGIDNNDDEPQKPEKKKDCSVPFGWLVDLFETKDMKDLLIFAQKQIDAGLIKVPDAWIEDEEFSATSILEKIIKNPKKGPCKAEDIKIQYIPFFLQIYMKLISTMQELVNRKKTNDIFKSNEPEKNDGNLIVDEKSSKIRKLILFSINLLRNMNMYANPLFFDDLYYYYYFLNLDKVFPSMDDFFRMFDTPEPEPKKNNSKVNVKMQVYEQFPNDDPSQAAQEEKHYGYEMVEKRTGANPETNFDWFLNLVQLHPDFYYKLPVVAETEKEFLFEEVPVDKEKPDGQQNVKIQVVNKEDPPKQEGGGFFDSIYSVFGFSGTSGLYKYLDDSPLPRLFEDVLKDENDIFDGTVNLCIYSLDNSCDFDGTGPTPFLKFIATKNGDKWGFPSFHYKSLQNHEQNNSSFKCELYNAIMDNLEIHLCDGIRGGAEPVPLSEGQEGQVEGEATPTPEGQVAPLPEGQGDVTTNPEPAPLPEGPEEQVTPAPEGPEEGEVANEPAPLLEGQEGEETPAPERQEEEVAPEPANDNIESVNSPESEHQEEIIVVEAKEGCGKLDSALDPMFIGLMIEDGQLFVFLNYDYLSTIVQTPENQAQSDLLFCRNDGTKLYPINDANTESKLKWATVDELLFEKKILTEEVDPTISAAFSKHYNLWNIEDSDENYIDFPFVVYAVEKTPEGKFKTIETVAKKEEEDDLFILNGKIENYGYPEKEGEDGIGDEYDARYCFTIVPFSIGDLQVESQESVTEQPSEESPVESTEESVTEQPSEGPPVESTEESVTEQPSEESPVESTEESVTEQPSEGPPVESTEELEQGNTENTNKTTGGSTGIPKRYVMFAWKTRYIVSESQVQEISGDQQTNTPDSNSIQTQTGGKEAQTLFETKPTKLDSGEPDSIIETITKEFESLRSPNENKKDETITEESDDSDESVKEEELDEEVNDLEPKENPLKLDLDEKSKEDESEFSSEIKDQMALERLKFPTIYTITNNEFTDNKPVVMWGILNSKQFTSL